VSVVLLVRHGQASFGSGDYDRLSPVGECQSRLLGRALAAQGVTPGPVVAGTMRRQYATAVLAAREAGWDVEVKSDPAWNEFDLDEVVRVARDHPAATDSDAFQVALEAGLRDWVSCDPVPGPQETHPGFSARVDRALQGLVAGMGARETAVVSTSAGVISWIASGLLGGGVEEWIRLNRVCVNAAVTKIVVGRRGMSLVSFNEHGHVVPKSVTYR
jgi:broad specificity phosphatase PhoE